MQSDMNCVPHIKALQFCEQFAYTLLLNQGAIHDILFIFNINKNKLNKCSITNLIALYNIGYSFWYQY